MDNELTLNDYLSIVKRRWGQILMAFILLLVISLIVIMKLPSVYKSEGLISIESPVVPDEVIKTKSPSAYVDESIEKIKEKVLSRENLIRLNQKYDLYPGITKPKELEKLLSKANIFITPETRDSSRNTWQNKKVTVGLVVAFKYSDPDTAYNVANELVKQLLDENVKARTKRVTETTGFLTAELDKLKGELEAVENKVAAYKQKHSNSLPEHQQMHMTSLEQLRTSIKDLDREYKATQEELRYLDVEYATSSASLNDPTVGLDPVLGISDLDKARAELDSALVQYKETHPTVRALKRKVALLEKTEQAPAPTKPKKANVAAELALSKIKTQIESANLRLESISSQKRVMNAKIASLQSQILKIPQVESGLFSLLRDYETAKANYEDVKAKQVNAKIAENLELDDKAERFTLKRSPELPEFRESPKRAQLMVFAMAGALILGLAIAFILEMLDPRVRGLAGLTSAIEMKPLVAVPYIETQLEKNKKRKAIRYLISVAVILILAAAGFAIYFFELLPTS